MHYIRPQITTVAGEHIVEAIGPATAASSGAQMPRPQLINLGDDSGIGSANR